MRPIVPVHERIGGGLSNHISGKQGGVATLKFPWLEHELGRQIAHDLSMVRHISDRMAVMYLGKFMELASGIEISTNPLHPYTQALMSAVPVPDPEVEEQRQRIILEGDIPSPANPPVGCNFNTRCPVAEDICFTEEPDFREIILGHYAACHLVK